MQSAICSKENLLRSVLTRYGSVILHTLGSTTIGYISVSFWISMPAGSWVIEYLVMPAQIWLLPHFEMLIRNEISRKTWHSIATGESNIHRALLCNCFRQMALSNHFLLLAVRMTMQSLKPFLPHSKKKRRTAESTPQNRASVKAWSSIFGFIMKFDHTKHWNTRHHRLLRKSIMPVLSKTGVQIAPWSENNTFPFGDFWRWPSKI